MAKLNAAPSKASKGGSLFASEGARGTITRARYKEWDFNGKAKFGNICAVQLSIKDEAGNEHQEYVKVGNMKSKAGQTLYIISDDGREVDVPGDAERGAFLDAPWTLFAQSIVNQDAAWDERFSSKGPACLDGLDCDFQRVKIKNERKQVAQPTAPGQPAQAAEDEVLIVTKLHGGKGASAGNGSSSDSEEAALYAQSLLSDAITEKGTLTRATISIEVNKRILKSDDDTKKHKDAILKKVINADFLKEGAEQGLWKYDEKAAKLTAA